MRLSPLLALLAAALVACAKGDSSAANAGTGTAAAVAAPSASHSGAQDVVDEATLRDFRLRDDNVTRSIRANLNLAQLMASNPGLADKLEAMSDAENDPKSLNDVIERIDAVPPVHKAIADAGISTRDWMLTLMEAMSAEATYEMHKQGLTKKLPSTVSPDNLSYAASHQEQMKRLSESAKRMNADTASDE